MFTVGSLVVNETGSINAKALGCPPNTGVGRGQKSYTGAGGGGGYGGVGGNGTFNGTGSMGGVAYGSTTLNGCVVGSGGGSSASEQVYVFAEQRSSHKTIHPPIFQIFYTGGPNSCF